MLLIFKIMIEYNFQGISHAIHVFNSPIVFFPLDLTFVTHQILKSVVT